MVNLAKSWLTMAPLSRSWQIMIHGTLKTVLILKILLLQIVLYRLKIIWFIVSSSIWGRSSTKDFKTGNNLSTFIDVTGENVKLYTSIGRLMPIPLQRFIAWDSPAYFRLTSWNFSRPTIAKGFPDWVASINFCSNFPSTAIAREVLKSWSWLFIIASLMK